METTHPKIEGHSNAVCDTVDVSGWWDELGVQDAPPDGLTSWELAEEWDVHVDTARRRIAKYCRSGKLKCVGRRSTTRVSDGIACKVPVYNVGGG